MINIKELAIPDVKLLTPKLNRDDRGYVTEIIREKQMQELGIDVELMQENQSYSTHLYTVRGLHFQKPPQAQAKLVRVIRGKALDIAVDIRPNSPTYGKHVAHILSADVVEQIYIPAGFAHGFCTLEPDTVMLYKVSAFYAPASEGGVLWNDPALGINWPVKADKAILSGKDEKLPFFKRSCPTRLVS